MLRISIVAFLTSLLLPVQVLAVSYVEGEVIVKLKDPESANSESVDGDKSDGYASKLSENGMERVGDSSVQYKIGGGQNTEDVVNSLSDDPDVEYAEPNYLYYKQSLGIEGEPLTPSELRDQFKDSVPSGNASKASPLSDGEEDVQGLNTQMIPTQIDAREGWEQLTQDPQVTPVVAIIDSGCDYNHYVFKETGAIWINEDEIPDNGIDDDKNGYVDDVRGWDFVNRDNDPMDDDNHGTHVAGIVLGITQDIFLGINQKTAPPLPRAKIRIMCLKFLDSEGVGNTVDAISAINYAVKNGAHIINNSWGGPGHSLALLEAITSAYKAKLTFVAAAGNISQDNDKDPNYPSSYRVPNILSVAATTHEDNLAVFSNFGFKSVHLGSPGNRILSTLPHGFPDSVLERCDPDHPNYIKCGTFAINSGTSMATPFVAGLAALMLRENKSINGYQMRNIFLAQSQKIDSLQGKVSSESRINALNMIDYVQTHQIPDHQPNCGDNCKGDSYRKVATAGFERAKDSAAGCGLVAKVLSKKGGPADPSSGGPKKGVGLFLILLFAPVFLTNFLRIREKRRISCRRKDTRFKMDSQVSIDVNGRKLEGQMSSISVGGASIDTSALLEKGGIVTLNISSPDGSQKIEVQGRVVWSQEKKSYGLQFCEAGEGTRGTIGSWTHSLSKI